MNLYICLLVISSCLAVVNANCLALPPVANAKSNNTDPGPFPEGTAVQMSCNDGYTPSGRRIYVCSGSKWIDGNFQCEEIFCGHVEKPRNGYVKEDPTYEVGSFMTFGCNKGYSMRGASRLLCRIDGQWNPREAPNCEIKNCGEFGDVPHGSTFQDNSDTERNTYGSVVEVECPRGYILVGSPFVKCDEDGNWGPRPTCDAVVCDPYPGFNSSCIDDTQFANNLLFMVCKDDLSVTKTGPYMVRCRDNSWDPDPDVELMACFCDCKVTVDSSVMSVRNLADGYLKHGHILEWSCIKGTKANNGALKCEDGQMDAPRCNPPVPSPDPVTKPVTGIVTGIVITTERNTKPPEESSNVVLIVALTIGGVVFFIAATAGGVLYFQQKKRKNTNNSNSNESSKMVSDTAEKPDKTEGGLLPLKPVSV